MDMMSILAFLQPLSGVGDFLGYPCQRGSARHLQEVVYGVVHVIVHIIIVPEFKLVIHSMSHMRGNRNDTGVNLIGA
jgi:hypothetical protein